MESGMRSFLPCVAPLWLLGAAVGQGCVDEGPEPNDFLGVPTVAGCAMRATGALAPGDSDYYAVVVAVPSVLKAYTSYGKASPLGVDTIVDIKDALDVLIGSDDDGGAGLWSYAGADLAMPGLYFVVVKGFAAATAGPYTLDIVCKPGPVMMEAPEPNNDPLLGGVPSLGACGLMHHGEIVAGDDDWWSFLHAGGSVTITTGPGGAGGGLAIVDSTIEVYDVLSVSVLPFNDDGGEALYSSISGVLPAGLYYVKVAGFGASVGHYSLRIGCGEPASVTADVFYPAGVPPGCIGALAYRASAPGGVRVRPRLGTTFSVDASGLPPLGPIVHVIGLSLLAPPVPLFPFGAPPACMLTVTPDAVTFAFASAVGEAQCCLFIPGMPVLMGLPLHFQVVTLAPLGSTNVVSSVIGNIAFP
jgi:hypothetical protein